MLLSFPLAAYVVVFSLAYVVVFSFGLCCCLFLWLMLLSFPLAAYVVVFSVFVAFIRNEVIGVLVGRIVIVSYCRKFLLRILFPNT